MCAAGAAGRGRQRPEHGRHRVAVDDHRARARRSAAAGAARRAGAGRRGHGGGPARHVHACSRSSAPGPRASHTSALGRPKSGRKGGSCSTCWPVASISGGCRARRSLRTGASLDQLAGGAETTPIIAAAPPVSAANGAPSHCQIPRRDDGEGRDQGGERRHVPGRRVGPRRQRLRRRRPRPAPSRPGAGGSISSAVPPSESGNAATTTGRKRYPGASRRERDAAVERVRRNRRSDVTGVVELENAARC